jgi:hypothetical protein
MEIRMSGPRAFSGWRAGVEHEESSRLTTPTNRSQACRRSFICAATVAKEAPELKIILHFAVEQTELTTDSRDLHGYRNNSGRKSGSNPLACGMIARNFVFD